MPLLFNLNQSCKNAAWGNFEIVIFKIFFSYLLSKTYTVIFMHNNMHW